MQEKGDVVLAHIQMIRDKHKEIERELSTLEMYALVMRQGIDPEGVAKYGYDPRVDEREPARPLISGRYGNDVRAWRRMHKVYNYVVLHNGARVNIDPVAVPGRSR